MNFYGFMGSLVKGTFSFKMQFRTVEGKYEILSGVSLTFRCTGQILLFYYFTDFTLEQILLYFQFLHF